MLVLFLPQLRRPLTDMSEKHCWSQLFGRALRKIAYLDTLQTAEGEDGNANPS